MLAVKSWLASHHIIASQYVCWGDYYPVQIFLRTLSALIFNSQLYESLIQKQVDQQVLGNHHSVNQQFKMKHACLLMKVVSYVVCPDLALNHEKDAWMGSIEANKNQRWPVALLVAEWKVLEMETIGWEIDNLPYIFFVRRSLKDSF